MSVLERVEAETPSSDSESRTGPQAPAGRVPGAAPDSRATVDCRTAVDTRTASSRRAYERRQRRQQRIAATALPGSASVPTVALDRAPFVAVVIALLGAGIAAVLWLNTVTDEAGLKTSTARSDSTDLRLSVEALERDVAMLDSTAHVAEVAADLGLVPAGDAAMLIVDAAGTATLVGEPTAVPGADGAPPPAEDAPLAEDASPAEEAMPAEEPPAEEPPAEEPPAEEPPAEEEPPADEAPPVEAAAPPGDQAASPLSVAEPAAPAEGTQP